MFARRQRLNPVLHALVSVLALSLALPQVPIAAHATRHGCSGTPATQAAAVMTAAGQVDDGCTHAAGCGPTLCCTGASPVLSPSSLLQTVSTALTSATPAASTRVPRLFLGGPPTPPPNS